MATEREAWLTLTMEVPIEPELPICDPDVPPPQRSPVIMLINWDKKGIIL